MTDGARKYAVVIERAYDEQRRPSNYGAYVPDLPGCVATGATRHEVACCIREAIESHIEVMREFGEPVPSPTTSIRTDTEG